MAINIEKGANKINSISPNSSIYQQAKDSAYAVGAIPAAESALSTMGALGQVVKYPIIMINYDAAANSTNGVQY